MAVGHPLRAAVPAHPLTEPPLPAGRRRAAAATPAAPRPASRRQRDELEAALGHRFANPTLLDEALTHSSVTGRFGRRKRSYERLEFLGDRVLGLVVAHMLFERFPEDPEGRLTDRQVALVQGATVAEVGLRLGLARLLEIARSEAEGEGRGERSRLADGCEALIGALYLDGGLEAARRFVEREWEPLLERVTTPPRDAKTTLQEWAQGRGLEPPAYRLLGADGPPHAPRFTVEVRLPDTGTAPTTGEGGSKRAAERQAAERLLRQVEGEGGDGGG